MTEAGATAKLTTGEPSSADVIAFMPKPDADAAVPGAGDGPVTVRAKPEKRKNAKERAKEKYAAKDSTKDRTTPDTTAKEKSKVEKKAKTEVKAKKAKRAGKVA